MLFQSRILNRFDFRFRREPPRDFHRVLAMPFHPQRQRFQSAQRQKAIERPCDRADCILQKRDLVAELLVFSHDDDTADHIGVAIQVFRGGMDYDIEPVFDRPLDPGAGESIIGNADGMVGARNFRHRFQVD